MFSKKKITLVHGENVFIWSPNTLPRVADVRKAIGVLFTLHEEKFDVFACCYGKEVKLKDEETLHLALYVSAPMLRVRDVDIAQLDNNDASVEVLGSHEKRDQVSQISRKSSQLETALLLGRKVSVVRLYSLSGYVHIWECDYPTLLGLHAFISATYRFSFAQFEIYGGCDQILIHHDDDLTMVFSDEVVPTFTVHPRIWATVCVPFASWSVSHVLLYFGVSGVLAKLKRFVSRRYALLEDFEIFASGSPRAVTGDDDVQCELELQKPRFEVKTKHALQAAARELVPES